jgi:hypothetical protein
MVKTGTVYMGGEENGSDKRFEPPSTGDIEQQDPTQAINKMANEPNRVLMKVSGTFPFDFFPDDITVDMQKVQIHYRKGPFETYTFPIPHQKLLTVKVSNSLFFASIEFEVDGYETNPSPVNYIPKGKARDLKHLVIGINAALSEQIDILETHLPPEELCAKLISIGASSTVPHAYF